MRKNAARAAGLVGVAAGLLALAAAAAGPALAGTTDTGGTATIAISRYAVAGLAKAGIVLLPGNSGTATYASAHTGHEVVSYLVTGGNANFIGASGTLDLAGTIQFIDGATGTSVTLTNLRFSYDTANISGAAGTTRVVLGQVGGAENGQSSAGPPATQTFTASAVITTTAGARYLDHALHTSYFKAGRDLGSFATTYDVTTS